ncbi:hypothetical protein ACU5AX_13360 [Sphingomonas sp. XXL09]|uniref:hypothetical protein n=1 Tax=Sphingomonas sp. XXL09 TaxID=3457787 RepID=UPI00406BB0E6
MEKKAGESSVRRRIIPRAPTVPRAGLTGDIRSVYPFQTVRPGLEGRKRKKKAGQRPAMKFLGEDA